MFNQDFLNNLNPELATIGALQILDRISDHNKEVQSAALAITLLSYCQRHSIDISSLFNVANNILGSNAIHTPSFTALKNYIQYEL